MKRITAEGGEKVISISMVSALLFFLSGQTLTQHKKTVLRLGQDDNRPDDVL